MRIARRACFVTTTATFARDTCGTATAHKNSSPQPCLLRHKLARVGDFNCKITWGRGVVTHAPCNPPRATSFVIRNACEMSDGEQLAHTWLASTSGADARAERGSLAVLPSGSSLGLGERQHAGLDLASAWSTRAWRVAGRASHLTPAQSSLHPHCVSRLMPGPDEAALYAPHRPKTRRSTFRSRDT